MGIQFCNPNDEATGTPYPAILTIDWDSLTVLGNGDDDEDDDIVSDETSSKSSIVSYVASSGYEISIPSVIVVNSGTGVGEYTIKAESLVAPENAYITVKADAEGSVSNGSKSLSFTNNLEDAKIMAAGDELAGSVSIDDVASVPGAYNGTIDFTINFFSGL